MTGPKSWPYIPSPPFTPVPTSPLLEILPPTASSLTELPEPPYPPTPIPGIPYKVSGHVIPAAFPRVSPYVRVPGATRAITKEERLASNERVFRDLRDLRMGYVKGEYDGEGRNEVEVGEGGMCNAINRYVHEDCVEGKRKGGLTLLLAHANGFPKEVRLNPLLSLL
jgi:hypothetical protein